LELPQSGADAEVDQVDLALSFPCFNASNPLPQLDHAGEGFSI
jgi:hypothetical protein